MQTERLQQSQLAQSGTYSLPVCHRQGGQQAEQRRSGKQVKHSPAASLSAENEEDIQLQLRNIKTGNMTARVMT